MNKIGIIGTGLIGGSLGMAARQAGHKVSCYNRKSLSSENAVKFGASDNFYNSIEELVENCEFIILACHVEGYEAALNAIKENIKHDIIISDVGSVKTITHRIAEEVLGDYSKFFIAAHPVAGKELSGLENADADLFKGKKAILTRSKTSKIDESKYQFVKNFWESLDTKIVELDSELHDQIYARISHFPQYLSFELSKFFPNSEIENMQEFSRLMNSPKYMWSDLFKYNSVNIKACLKDFIEMYYSESKIFKFTNSGEIDYPQIAHLIATIYLKIVDINHIDFGGSGFKSFTSAYDENKNPVYNVISQPTKVKLEQIIRELENSNLSWNF